MGKPTPKNKLAAPTAHSVPPKGVAASSHKIAKRAPRHPQRQTTIQYFREAAAALVSSHGSRPRSSVTEKLTPLKSCSKSSLDTTKDNSRPPSMTHRRSRSCTKVEDERSEKADQFETTYVIENDEKDNVRSATGTSHLRRSGTFVVRSTSKQVAHSDRREQTNDQLVELGRKSSQATALRHSRSHSSSLDKLIDPIMDCMTTLEKQHQECINAMLRSCVTNTLQSRKIRPSADSETSESQVAEVDLMIRELSEEYQSKIEKLLVMKRHRLKEFMISQLRQRQIFYFRLANIRRLLIYSVWKSNSELKWVGSAKRDD
ncbi:unnamed protein product [Allacma fusca]|uniref:Uncharacterized protein n=1 Tax=Allacma fusca TaxID=39272 RepID=A0A8J2PYP8_9HEXA|nr:unnamed protein product [Allacma fusca]